MSLAVLLAARLLAPTEVPAEPAPLRWVAADASCPDGAHVRQAAEELAGRWPSKAELEVDAFAQGQGAQWDLVLTVVVAGRVHRQSLQAESCAALGRAAALIIAVSIDPVRSAVPVPMAALPAPPPTVVEDAREPASPEAATRQGGAPRVRLRPQLGVGWGAVFGMTPGVSSGPHLSIGLDGDRSRFALVGRYVLPRTRPREGTNVSVQAGTVGARACLASRPRTVRGHLCGTVESGAIRARGDRTRHYPWLAGVVGGGVRWRFAPRVSLAVDLEASVAVFDAQVVLGPTDVPSPDVVFETSRLGGRGMLGLAFDFSPRG